ncbi:MAG TPA: hypothetical protein VND93_07135 [Myxococcales bacterium]|nr:hypothetical protein [Myxococcales bacterium]
MHVLLVLLLLSGAPDGGSPPAGEPITKKNWLAHPKIAAVRAVVQQNEDAIKAKGFKHQERKDCDMEGAGEESEAVDRDGAGVIRKYVHEVRTEDSGYRAEAHYDEKGRLRFVFARRGAMNESSGEFRIYFDEDGKRLWTDAREKGPGYTWMKDFPDAWLQKDPEKAWKNPPPCE